MSAPEYLEEHRSPLADRLGIVSVSAGDGAAHYRLPFAASNVTVGDVVHGGAILTLADCAATGAVWSEVESPQRYRGLTANLSLSFLSAAHGVDLDARARVVRRGRSLVFCQVDVAGSDGTAIATAQVTYKLSYLATPAETMTSLFAGHNIGEQMRLLAELEATGATLYEAWAEQIGAGEARQQLLDSAARETLNARTLQEILRAGETSAS